MAKEQDMLWERRINVIVRGVEERPDLGRNSPIVA
jgi:hypothetical protein